MFPPILKELAGEMNNAFVDPSPEQIDVHLQKAIDCMTPMGGSPYSPSKVNSEQATAHALISIAQSLRTHSDKSTADASKGRREQLAHARRSTWNEAIEIARKHREYYSDIAQKIAADGDDSTEAIAEIAAGNGIDGVITALKEAKKADAA